jgi:lipopolysaccharide transport system permease protein
VPAAWRFAYGLNPMATVVEGFRWSLVGSAAPSVEMIAVSVTVTTVAIGGGVWYFRRTEGVFADVI